MTDASSLREALAHVIANERREWRRERELIEAQARESVSELRAKIVELERSAQQLVAERLAGLKDGASVTVEDVAPLIVSEVERAFSTVKPPKDGKDADPKEIAALLLPEVERAVACLPKPENGKDADPAVIEAMVTDAVNKLPAPSPGRDADPEVIIAAIHATLGERVAEAVAALPPAQSGKDADLTEVRNMIDDAFAALPVPEVREDVAPEDVAENVARAIRMIAEVAPKCESPAVAPVINLHSVVNVPEAKAHQVNVTMPEQAAPVVNVAPPNIVIEAKRSKEVTKVTGYDKNGRIASFEKTEIDD